MFLNLYFLVIATINQAIAGPYCGSEGSTDLAPDKVYQCKEKNNEWIDLGPACKIHDECYDICNVTQKYCDQQFKNDMLSICAKFPRPCEASCIRTAFTYYGVVALFGGAAFRRSQVAACAEHCGNGICHRLETVQGCPKDCCRLVNDNCQPGGGSLPDYCNTASCGTPCPRKRPVEVGYINCTSTYDVAVACVPSKDGKEDRWISGLLGCDHDKTCREAPGETPGLAVTCNSPNPRPKGDGKFCTQDVEGKSIMYVPGYLSCGESNVKRRCVIHICNLEDAVKGKCNMSDTRADWVAEQCNKCQDPPTQERGFKCVEEVETTTAASTSEIAACYITLTVVVVVVHSLLLRV